MTRPTAKQAETRRTHLCQLPVARTLSFVGSTSFALPSMFAHRSPMTPMNPTDDESTHGSFATYEEAKAAAKRNLINEWDRSFFETYQESEHGDYSGGFEVFATCPEGEEMTVYIEYDGSAAPVSIRPKMLYQVVEKRNGEEFQRHMSTCLYDSIAAANSAARAYCNPARKGGAEEYNVDSRTEAYSGTVDI